MFIYLGSHPHLFSIASQGSSSSIGAPRVTAACVDFRAAAQAADVDAMRQHLKSMRAEFTEVSATLSEIVALEAKIKQAAGGS